jgi:hypothetical protein
MQASMPADIECPPAEDFVCETTATRRNLPDLMDRIESMGLGEQYSLFRERYHGWRQGKPKGASGDCTAVELQAKEQGAVGKWCPRVQGWKWRRTISFWIALTFFTGSIFFAISSFLYNYPDMLGDLAWPVTTGGYIAGKVNFFVCTYLMCIEVVNLTAVHGANGDAGKQDEQPFWYCPFYWRTAFSNLEAIGAGPWPYYASVTFFIGVLVFAIGLAAEMIPGIPEAVEQPVLQWSFLLGSILFVLGGLAECIDSDVFTSLKFDKGYVGALCNMLGGMGFLIGAILAWFDSYSSNFAYGVGSVIYLLGSSVMIIMWEDQQYGLTFLAVLNQIESQRRLSGSDRSISSTSEKSVTFSRRGVVFIHIYCIAVAFGVYNFNMEIFLFKQRPTLRALQLAVNELMPSVICLMVLTLASAVVKTPKAAPYHQLFLALRVLSLLMVCSSISTFVEFLARVIHQ